MLLAVLTGSPGTWVVLIFVLLTQELWTRTGMLTWKLLFVHILMIILLIFFLSFQLKFLLIGPWRMQLITLAAMSSNNSEVLISLWTKRQLLWLLSLSNTMNKTIQRHELPSIQRQNNALCGKVPHSGIWGHIFVSVWSIWNADYVSLQIFWAFYNYCVGRYVVCMPKVRGSCL